MKLVEHKEANGKVRTYKVHESGTYYNSDTPDRVIDLLEYARERGYYVWFRLGDRETGRDWLETCDVTGYVSRSMGPIKIPILLATKRSTGGGGILTDCIIRLMVHTPSHKRDETWQAENYQLPALEVYAFADARGQRWTVRSQKDGKWKIVSMFGSYQSAKRYIDFITGRRLNR